MCFLISSKSECIYATKNFGQTCLCHPPPHTPYTTERAYFANSFTSLSVRIAFTSRSTTRRCVALLRGLLFANRYPARVVWLHRARQRAQYLWVYAYKNIYYKLNALCATAADAARSRSKRIAILRAAVAAPNDLATPRAYRMLNAFRKSHHHVEHHCAQYTC